MTRLPSSLDALTGLRAARWSRESTAGQFDAFGPEAQREQQDRAIERWGLVDTGLAWTVAHSGRTVADTDQFRDMLARAGTDYDVLVVGYVSRFARDARVILNARHDMHAAGAVILFADEKILTSDEDRWDEFYREAGEAESYSRKLARRIREGYAAKRRRLGEPGGRPPFAFVREGRPPTLRVDRDARGVVESCFELSGGGASDRAVSQRLGLSLHTVRSVLTNPIYIGQLRDGTPASVEPIVDRATWDRVQALRRARNARAGRPAVTRAYALPMLCCEACGRRLIGDSGRYRHLDPCREFSSARRKATYRNRLVRSKGYSQPADLYELWVELALEVTALSTADLTQAASVYSGQMPVDEVELRRIAKSREQALASYARTRDVAELQRQMANLDDQEQSARNPTTTRPKWSEVVAILKDLPAMWREAEPEDRRRLAQVHITEATALGARRMAVTFHDGVRAVVSAGSNPFAPTITVMRTPLLTEDERTA